MASDPHPTTTDPRQEARLARASRLEAARGELAEASGRGEGGRHAMRQYSHRMDALVQQLCATHPNGVVVAVDALSTGAVGTSAPLAVALPLYAPWPMLLTAATRYVQETRAPQPVSVVLVPVPRLSVVGHVEPPSSDRCSV